MPEPLIPGVYIEELATVRSIEGLPTSTAAFVGTFQSGLIARCEQLRDIEEAQMSFGDLETATGYAIRQFFLNGGRDCWAVPVSGAIDRANRVAAIAEGIAALDQIDSFNLLCIPETSELDVSAAGKIIGLAEAYCERRRAFMLVDAPQLLRTPDDISAWLDGNTSLRHRNAALYYPHVKLQDHSGAEHTTAASGTIAGVIARTDRTRGVWKAPAGAEAKLKNVAALEHLLTDTQNDLLNQRRVNCLRDFPGIGIVCWGARTLSTNPDWKYVSVRRLFLYLEASIERGLQWVVFEPNEEPLWARVRQTAEYFLSTLWRAGAFQGNTQKTAYYVKCDRTTMSQSDIDSGRLVVEIGVAPIKPAEFVIIRIGLWTASKK